MVDTLDLGSSLLYRVGVQVPFLAFYFNKKIIKINKIR